MTDVENAVTVGISSESTIMKNDGSGNDDDEMADLFSFGATALSNIAADANTNGVHESGLFSPIQDANNITTTENAMRDHLTRSESVGSHDSFMDMLDAESTAIMDLTRITSANDHSNPHQYDNETIEILQWLDTSGSRRSSASKREDDSTMETITFHSDDDRATEVFGHSNAPDSTPVLTPPTPTFVTLEDALKSNLSTKDQIRELANKKLSSCEPLFSSLEEAMVHRPELYCRMICGGKTLSETATCSLADSFEQWKYHLRQQQTIKSNNHNLDVLWIRKQASLLSHNISMAIGRAAEDCEIDLNDLLLYHYHNDISGKHRQTSQQQSQTSEIPKMSESTTAMSSNIAEVATTSQDGIVAKMTSNPEIGQHFDAFLPAVVTSILSANIPVTPASVVLAQIIPTYMPLLALAPSERWEATLLLHAEFYVLACYHIPYLVLHLDRHLPGWQWPRNRALLLQQSSDGSTVDKENISNNSVVIGRNLTKQGQIPASWLLCHLAGECSYSGDANEQIDKLILDANTLLQLWDGILTSNNNKATRFFLTLALLEQAADKLIILTGDELVSELQSVWSLPPTYFPPELKWREHQWWSSAMALQTQTPKCVIERAQRSEDVAIQEALKQRRLKAEAEIQNRLDAEAAAHKQAQEVLAQQARDRLSRARLVAFYRQHAPDKESNIDMIMSAYNGRLHILDQKLKAKYGVGFNPALDPKRVDDNQDKKSSSNVFLATMNQGFNAIGRQISMTSNQSSIEEDACVIPTAKDQVSVTVSPEELLPILCWSKDAAAARGVSTTKAQTISYWDNLKYVLVDSRTDESATEQGRFPTALQLSPDFLMDPERIKENEDRFESLRGACHLVVMGEGYSSLPKLYNQKLSPKLEALMKEDDARTNGCALFFFKKGFPFVSILEGGYAGALSWLSRDGRKHHLYPSSVLIDYDPNQSLFGQLESLFSSSASEKAQKKMQKLLETSLVTMTKHVNTLEKLSSNVDSVEKESSSSGMTSFMNPFAGLGGKKEDNTDANSESNKSLADSTQVTHSSNTEAEAASKLPVNNPFKGFGAALNNTLKTASTMASGTNNNPGGNPSGNVNASISMEVDSRASAGPALPNVLKRNPFSRFGGNAVNTDDGKKAIESGSQSLVVPGFGSLNQFRKTTMARMQVQRNPNADAASATIVDLPPLNKNSDTTEAPQIKKL